MKDYKRLTERDEFGNADIIGVDSGILASALDFDELNKLTSALNKFADLEDKIERGEIDYVVDKDKEIERLTAENTELRARLDKAVELPLLKTKETNDMLVYPKYFDFTIRVKIKWLMNENKNSVMNMEYNIEEEKKFLKELGNLCERYGVKADYKLETSKKED